MFLNGLTNCSIDTFFTVDYYSAIKGIKYQYIQQFVWIPKEKKKAAFKGNT